MNWISFNERILQEGDNAVDVVLSHVTNILEHEAKRLQNAILNVEFRDSIFIHECRENSERPTCLCDNSNCDCGADTHLAILNLEVVQQCMKDILGTDCSGNESKCTNSGPANRFFMGLQHFQQFKADTHPFFRRHKLSAAICDSAY